MSSEKLRRIINFEFLSRVELWSYQNSNLNFEPCLSSQKIKKTHKVLNSFLTYYLYTNIFTFLGIGGSQSKSKKLEGYHHRLMLYCNNFGHCCSFSGYFDPWAPRTQSQRRTFSNQPHFGSNIQSKWIQWNMDFRYVYLRSEML